MLASTVLALPVLALTPSPAAARAVAVAVDQDDGGASVALIDVRAPWRSRTGIVPIGRDSMLRARGRVVDALSRYDGSLRVVDPHRGQTLHVVELGAASHAEDLEVVSARRVYVTRRGSTHLLRVDPTTGRSEEVVDLGSRWSICATTRSSTSIPRATACRRSSSPARRPSSRCR